MVDPQGEWSTDFSISCFVLRISYNARAAGAPNRRTCPDNPAYTCLGIQCPVRPRGSPATSGLRSSSSSCLIRLSPRARAPVSPCWSLLDHQAGAVGWSNSALRFVRAYGPRISRLRHQQQHANDRHVLDDVLARISPGTISPLAVPAPSVSFNRALRALPCLLPCSVPPSGTLLPT